MILTVFGVIIALIIVLYSYGKYVTSYWARHNIPYEPAIPWIGNLWPLFTKEKTIFEITTDIYNDKKFKDCKVVGIQVFNKPTLLIRDPQIIQSFLVTDFNQFANRGPASNTTSDPLSAHSIFFADHTDWKPMRSKLTSVFSSARIKLMFGLMKNVCDTFNELLDSQTREELSNLNFRETCASFAIDIIATCAFGVNAKSLINHDSEFGKCGRALFELTPYRQFTFAAYFLLPELVPLFNLKFFTHKYTHFLRKSVEDMTVQREKNGNIRNDLIDLMVKLRKGKERVNDKLTWEGDVLYAQAALFFLAGFETTSALIFYTAYELCKHEDVQKKLRQEIKEMLQQNNNKIEYDAMNEMPYLNMVCQETLRLYPPVAYIDRVCNAPMGYSLKKFDVNFKIPNNMRVMAPSFATSRDPKFYPEPMKFIPERYAPTNKANFSQYTALPFGAGPRSCIGQRFGTVAGKLGIVNFFMNYRVQPNAKTKDYKQCKGAFLLQPQDTIYFDIIKDELI